MSYYLTTQTPVGLIGIHGALSITKISWAARPMVNATAELEKARDQITAYFAGALQRFDLCLKPSGTKFQQAVWNRILLIPYGTTSTYGEVAKKLRTSARAVGRHVPLTQFLC